MSEQLERVKVDIAVVLGRTKMPIHQILRLARGTVIELDTTENDQVEVLANNMPVAMGQVVINGNRIAVELTEILPRPITMR